MRLNDSSGSIRGFLVWSDGRRGGKRKSKGGEVEKGGRKGDGEIFIWRSAAVSPPGDSATKCEPSCACKIMAFSTEWLVRMRK